MSSYKYPLAAVPRSLPFPVSESLINSSTSKGINPPDNHILASRAKKCVSFQRAVEIIGYSVPDETPEVGEHSLAHTISPTRHDSVYFLSVDGSDESTKSKKRVRFQEPVEIIGYSVPDVTCDLWEESPDDSSSSYRDGFARIPCDDPHHGVRKVNGPTKRKRHVRFSCLASPKPTITPGLLNLRQLRRGSSATKQGATKRVRFGCLQNKEARFYWPPDICRGTEVYERWARLDFKRISMEKKRKLGFCPMPQLAEVDESEDGNEEDESEADSGVDDILV